MQSFAEVCRHTLKLFKATFKKLLLEMGLIFVKNSAYKVVLTFKPRLKNGKKSKFERLMENVYRVDFIKKTMSIRRKLISLT